MLTTADAKDSSVEIAFGLVVVVVDFVVVEVRRVVPEGVTDEMLVGLVIFVGEVGEVAVGVDVYPVFVGVVGVVVFARFWIVAATEELAAVLRPAVEDFVDGLVDGLVDDFVDELLDELGDEVVEA